MYRIKWRERKSRVGWRAPKQNTRIKPEGERWFGFSSCSWISASSNICSNWGPTSETQTHHASSPSRKNCDRLHALGVHKLCGLLWGWGQCSACRRGTRKPALLSILTFFNETLHLRFITPKTNESLSLAVKSKMNLANKHWDKVYKSAVKYAA